MNKILKYTIIISVIYIFAISMLFLFFSDKGIHIYQDGKEVENLTLVQRLQFLEQPNETLVTDCYSEYQNYTGNYGNQSYWIKMHECLGNTTQLIIYDIPKINVTKELLESECYKIKENKYNCGRNVVKW